jgi:hypothetical protein
MIFYLLSNTKLKKLKVPTLFDKILKKLLEKIQRFDQKITSYVDAIEKTN